MVQIAELPENAGAEDEPSQLLLAREALEAARYSEAVEHSNDAIEVLKQSGKTIGVKPDPLHQGEAYAVRAEANLQKGELDAALPDLESAKAAYGKAHETMGLNRAEMFSRLDGDVSSSSALSWCGLLTPASVR